MEYVKGKVYQGTCGWSDPSIVKCGRFYPRFVKTCEEKLTIYSGFFSCAECDSSNYAIPSPFKIKKWLNCVPDKFLFHFKAYGLFTRQQAPWNSVPSVVRTKYSDINQGIDSSNVSYSSLPTSMKQDIWDLFNQAIEPAFKESKLGVVVFQFPLNFQPSEESRKHVEHCRTQLDSNYKMVVEFRCRLWLSESNKGQILDWLRGLKIGLVVADELHSELYFGRRPTPSYVEKMTEDNPNPKVVPIVMALADPGCCYVRIHRREGTQRLLSESEIRGWAKRLGDQDLQRAIKGPIFFMWGTDHEDQPILNSKKLTRAIGDLALAWQPKKRNSLLAFCQSHARSGEKWEADGSLRKEGDASEVKKISMKEWTSPDRKIAAESLAQDGELDDTESQDSFRRKEGNVKKGSEHQCFDLKPNEQSLADLDSNLTLYSRTTKEYQETQQKDVTSGKRQQESKVSASPTKISRKKASLTKSPNKQVDRSQRSITSFFAKS